MKKIVFILIIGVGLIFNGCDFKNKISFFSRTDTLEAYKLKMDSLKKADSIRLVKERQMAIKKKAYQDSLQRIQEAKALAAKNRYHVIAGSFKTPKYAESYYDLMAKQGYQVKKVTNEYGFECISIYATDTYGKALSKVKELKAQQGDEVEYWVFANK